MVHLGPDRPGRGRRDQPAGGGVRPARLREHQPGGHGRRPQERGHRPGQLPQPPPPPQRADHAAQPVVHGPARTRSCTRRTGAWAGSSPPAASRCSRSRPRSTPTPSPSSSASSSAGSGSGRCATGPRSWPPPSRWTAPRRAWPARSSTACARRTAMTSVQAGEVEAVHALTTEHVYAPAAGRGRGPDRHPDHGSALHLPLQRQLDHEPDPGGLPRPRLLLQPVPGQAAGARGRRADPAPPHPQGVPPGAPPELHRLLRAGAHRDHRPGRDRASTRSPSPPTRGTSTSTGPATPTTASTPSTCGTGARTRWSTWVRSSSSAATATPCAGSASSRPPPWPTRSRWPRTSSGRTRRSPTSTPRRCSWRTSGEPGRGDALRRARPACAAAGRSGFPWSAPTWPDGVERPAPERQPRRRLRHRLDAPVPGPLRPRPAPRQRDPAAHPRHGLAHRRAASSSLDLVEAPGDLRGQPRQPRRHAGAPVGPPGPVPPQDRGGRRRRPLLRPPLEGARCGPCSLGRHPDRAPPGQPALGRPGRRRCSIDGWNLVIYPEGGRTPDGWFQEFRGGRRLPGRAHRAAGRARPPRRDLPDPAQGRRPPAAAARPGSPSAPR